MGKQDPTQFERLLEELEITSIAARSPQAKGRVERLFGTDTRSPGHRTPRSQVRTPASKQANEVLQAYLPRVECTVCSRTCSSRTSLVRKEELI